MEETIFSQRVNYAIIEKYRSYSHITDKPIESVLASDLNSLFSNERVNQNFDIGELPPVEVRGKKLKQLFHFTSPKKDGERIRIPRSPLGGIFLTQDSNKIGRALSDPFSNIRIFTRENRIIKEGNTVKLVMDVYLKHKDFNHKYARKRVNKVTVKFDFDKGNTLIMKQRGNHKEFRTNSIWFFDDIELDHFREIFPKSLNSKNEPISKKHKDIKILMNINLLMVVLRSVCSEFVDLSQPLSIVESHHDKKMKDSTRSTLKKISLLNLVKGKGIKVPNNYEDILMYYYPTQKYLKRNNYKLIQSCLDRMGINHSPCIKIAHNDFEKIFLILEIRSIIGSDYYRYIPNIRWDLMENYVHCVGFRQARYYAYGVREETPTLKTKKEKSNFIKILNETLHHMRSGKFFEGGAVNGLLKEYISDVIDHIRIMEKISDVNPHVSLNACTYKTFGEEHRLYSKIERRMDRDSTVLLEYDEQFIDLINEPFEVGESVIKPILLVNEDDYIDEGEEMNHCVAGYVGKRGSVIISLTETETNERSTLEFDVNTGGLVQERSKYNKKPTDTLLMASKVMIERFNSVSSSMRVAVRKRIDKNGNYIDYEQGTGRGVMRFPIDF